MSRQTIPPSSATLGSFTLYAIETGRFRLDGGAIFGVVPKALWSRKVKADDQNRIDLAMRSLLIRSEKSGRIYLVDTGTGTKLSEKMVSNIALDYEHSDLLSSLDACGVQPEDITDIIFTHLHFDHCGGTTYYNESGSLEHRFPNAIYHVNRKHMETVRQPNVREKASFYDDNVQPIFESDRLNLVEDLHVYEEDLSTLPAYGHTMGQQLPVVEGDGKAVVFAADLIASAAHVPLPWVMAYDMEPLQTLREKEAFLKQAVEHQWYLFMQHDAINEMITVVEQGGRYSHDRSLTLEDLERE